MSDRTFHVIGAGLSGLSAAVALSEREVAVELSEAAPQAGGRCRSLMDPVLGIQIDNGNHLVLGGNDATRDYLDAIGGELRALPSAIRFFDRRDGRRWTVEPGDGSISRLFPSLRGVPDTTFGERLRLAAFLRGNRGRRVGEVYRCAGPLWDRLLRPFLLAVLNTDPADASAELAGAAFRQTLARGAAACRPMVADRGLSPTFVDPALELLAQRDVVIRFSRRLRGLTFDDADGHRVAGLQFDDGHVAVGGDDAVILAVSPWAAGDLVPGLTVPDDHRPIVNAHYRVVPSSASPAIVGVVGGTAEWIFVFADRVSVTVSDARHLVDVERERLAAMLWDDVAAALGLAASMPPWSIIVEKRATFASTHDQVARRPPSRTEWKNLFLAGDWIDTGLPATIEGAIRSGREAADLAAGHSAPLKKRRYAEGLTDRVAHG